MDETTRTGDETMTTTHLSHFDLTQSGLTGDRVYLDGTLAACKRMAFAHGCAIAGEEGRIIEINEGRAICNMNDITAYWLADANGEHAGMIHKGRDAWTLALDLKVWEQD
jgi:hypothetical protein